MAETHTPPGSVLRNVDPRTNVRRGHLLVCTGHFWPHVGGVERHALELWGRLASAGWRVQVLTANTGGSPERETIRGMDVIRLPVLNLMQRRMPLPFPSVTLLRCVRELGIDRPDVVVTNTRFFPSTALGQLLARAWRRPTLHIEHGSGHAVTGSSLGDLASKLVDHTVGAAVLKGATRCVGVSGAVVDFVRSLGRPDAGVLYNGVDVASFQVDGARERLALGVPPDVPVVLFIGRLFADKGVLSLWEAFHRLRAEKGAHLVVAGDGPLASDLRSKAQGFPNVHLLGFVEARRIPGLLAASDIVAHPSACAEGLPTVVLEAAAAGRAIVASTVGGTPEVIQHNESGLLIHPNDSTALQQSLERLCNSPDLRKRLGAAANARCRRVFDWESVVACTERELRALMGER